MHKLSVVSLAALVAVGGILAFAVFVHPSISLVPVQNHPTQHLAPPSSAAGSNSSLLTQAPPSSGTGGSDDGTAPDT